MPAPYWTPKADRYLQASREADLVEINETILAIHNHGGLSSLIDDQPEMFGYPNDFDGKF